jgi:hypothetical protein
MPPARKNGKTRCRRHGTLGARTVRADGVARVRPLDPRAPPVRGMAGDRRPPPAFLGVATRWPDRWAWSGQFAMPHAVTARRRGRHRRRSRRGRQFERDPSWSARWWASWSGHATRASCRRCATSFSLPPATVPYPSRFGPSPVLLGHFGIAGHVLRQTRGVCPRQAMGRQRRVWHTDRLRRTS